MKIDNNKTTGKQGRRKEKGRIYYWLKKLAHNAKKKHTNAERYHT